MGHQHPRLLRVVLFHAVFSCSGDLLAGVLNLMSVPVRSFLQRSLFRRYGLLPGSEEFELVYSALATSFFVGVFSAGLLMGHLMETYGRKGTGLYLRSSLAIASASSMILAKWLEMAELFFVGHFLAGVLCMFKNTLFVYMAECAPDASRGWAVFSIGTGGALVVMFAVPLCLPGILGNDHYWTLLPALCLLMAMVHLFVGSSFPESPKHLFIGKGDRDRARHAVHFYHGSRVDIADVLAEYESEQRVLHRESVKWTDFWGSNRLRCSLAILLIVSTCPSVSLVNLKSQYLVPMLMRYGLDQSGAMVATMVLTALAAPFCLVAPHLVERKGRRPLFLGVVLLSTLELLLFAGAQALFDVRGRGGWVVAALALMGTALGHVSLNLGIFNMTPILVGELFPHPARAKATQIALLLPMPIVFVVVLAYPPLIDSIGALFFLALFLLSLVFLSLMWKCLPETKGRPVDEIFRKVADSPSPSAKSSSAISYGSLEERNSEENEHKRLLL